MIILKSTTDKIQVVLSASVATNQLPCYASFRDTKSGTTLDPDRSVVNTNNTTVVDFISAPAAATQRGIDFISIHNADTAAATVTVIYNANGTTYTLKVASIGVGESIEYNSREGWRVIANSGAVKHSLSQGNTPASSGWNQVVLGSDVTNNNAVANTMQDVTGLSFPVTTGLRYKFKAFIWYTSAATTTGSRWSINGPSATSIIYQSVYSLTTTTQTTNHGLTAYDLPAASNGTSAATAGNTAIIEGELTPTANGTVIVRFASEVLSSAIIAKSGSTIEWIQVL